MKYSIAALILSVGAHFSAFADVLKVKPDAPQQYVVKRGDTLWDISTLYLNTPWRWPELWQWNPQIDDPDLIYPGDVLSLEYDSEGRPRLMIRKGVKKLSPTSRIVVQKNSAIPTLPLAMIEPFLRYDQAITADQLDGSPIVLGSSRNVLVNTQGHLLYIKGNLNPSASYGIYRQGKPYTDPVTGRTLAYESRYIGSARVLTSGDIAQGVPAKVTVETVRQEIKTSDVLLPIAQGQTYSAQFNMSRPEHDIEAVIVSSDNQMRAFGPMTIVVLNKGREDNLREGHILDISKQSPTVIEGKNGPRYVEDANRLEKFITGFREIFGTGNDEDSVVWTMPKEKIGELMVFKVYDNISYAMVMRAQAPVRIGDTITSH